MADRSRRESITVAAAVIGRADAFLLTRRLEGTHLAGCWEFPGGKQHEGETLEQCLVREIFEELGCRARVAGEMIRSTHHYPERTVTLHFFACEIEGVAVPQQGQEMRWVSRRELGTLPLPEADRALVDLLRSDDVLLGREAP